MVSSVARILVLVSWIVLGSAAANADTITPIIDTDNGYEGVTVGALSVTRMSNVSPGWDEIDLHIASWAVTVNNANPPNQNPFGGGPPSFIVMIAGTWSGVGGNLGVSPLSGSDWVPQTTNNNSSTPLQSFVNLDATDGQSSFVRGGGSVGSYAFFGSGGGDWGTNFLPNTQGGSQQQEHGLGPVDESVGAADDGVDETLLAKIYVTSGGDVTFAGWFGSIDGFVHPPWARSLIGVSFTTAVPEPSVFTLLATGLIGIAVRAWRKRGG